MTSVDLGGLEDVLNALARVAGRLDGPEVKQEIAQVVLRRADSRVPRRTGRLAASGRVIQGAVAYGSAQVPYAVPVHWGVPQRNIAAQPWVSKTLGDSATVQQVLDAWEKGVQQIIDKETR